MSKMERFDGQYDMAVMVAVRPRVGESGWNLRMFHPPRNANRAREGAPREAKDVVQEHHLPWQKPQENLTPQRVAQSMFSLLIEIGSPTRIPKTRGKSAGCQKGHKRMKRKRYPLVKKRRSRSKKSAKKAA